MKHRTTQYEVIGKLISRRRGATNYELIAASGSVCPWKRMEEMARRGWQISREQVPGKTHLIYRGVAPQQGA